LSKKVVKGEVSAPAVTSPMSTPKTSGKIKPLPKPKAWQKPSGASLSQKKVNQRAQVLLKEK